MAELLAPQSGSDLTNGLLARLRKADVRQRVGSLPNATSDTALAEFEASGVTFVASDETMERRFYEAVTELLACIKANDDGSVMLNEGGVYYGCWLESTGTINAELLSRFMPGVAAETFAGFARHQREDGLFPYKIGAGGPTFSQIQIVSPFARSVWNHYLLNGKDNDYLAQLYRAMARNDDWLAQWRDTRNTGAVEAFCTFDTGHDLSARFWHVPDSPAGNDPKAYRKDNPVLPFIAPDLTANIACQRHYLALMAEALGEDGAIWRDKAEKSRQALMSQCFDPDDGFFYDRDRNDQFVQVQSDVLLRVLACEVGDEDFFAEAASRYLLNTRKFFAKYPFTSLALDDPRFDPAFDYNSWCGPTNFLSLIRAPQAFEHHGRYVELTWMLYPILSALFSAQRFAQTINPFTGAAGFTETYSPSILCLLDFVERLCGILPRPDDTLWFTGLVPYQIDHRDIQHATAYARAVDGHRFEAVNDGEVMRVWRDGEPLFSVPKGVRAVTRRDGTLTALIGMSVSPVHGALRAGPMSVQFSIGPNEELAFQDGALSQIRPARLVHPTY